MFPTKPRCLLQIAIATEERINPVASDGPAGLSSPRLREPPPPGYFG